MIVQEEIMTRKDGVRLMLTQSSDGYKIMNEDGIVYDEAIDVMPVAHTYTETSEKRTIEESEQTGTDS